jgi:protein-S-isoprenylcysteine O-methyltransferase Ste14
MSVIGVVFFLNIALIGLFPSNMGALIAAGYAILGIGASLCIVSALTLQKKGVENIVDSGVYAIVRHPMYLGAMMMFFSHIFLSQSWIVLFASVTAIVSCYLIVLSGDERNIEKFGDAYKLYMQRVPRMNLLFGIIRLFRNQSTRQ